MYLLSLLDKDINWQNWWLFKKFCPTGNTSSKLQIQTLDWSAGCWVIYAQS